MRRGVAKHTIHHGLSVLEQSSYNTMQHNDGWYAMHSDPVSDCRYSTWSHYLRNLFVTVFSTVLYTRLKSSGHLHVVQGGMERCVVVRQALLRGNLSVNSFG